VPRLRVGLTGGIGSGKSEVARRLAARGAVVVDADVLAREVVARDTDGLAAVVEEFGRDVVGADGWLDRPVLGRRVFGDELARRRLETIVHPRVRARAAELEAAAGATAVVVHDIPLLVETGQGEDFDVVVVVDAPDDERVSRLVAVRGLTADEARSRLAVQASTAQRLAVADEVVVNDGSLEQLDHAVDELWRRLTGSGEVGGG